MRSMRNRVALLERAHHLQHDVPLWQRVYYLPHTVYARVLVNAFREGNLAIKDGCIISPKSKRFQDGWFCPRLAYVLNACADWGDVFIDAAEIVAARELLDLGWIGFGRSYTEAAPYQRPPRWQVLLGHAATHALYVSDRDRYFAAHATGRTFDPAIKIAAWRAGAPITTLDQVQAWIATAQPLTLSMAMLEAIGPITASAYVAHSYGLDLDQLERADNEAL